MRIPKCLIEFECSFVSADEISQAIKFGSHDHLIQNREGFFHDG